MKTNLKTSYSKSPVISIEIGYGHIENKFKLLLALTSDGEIYRTCKLEECEEVEEFEAKISELTIKLIGDKYVSKNIGLTDLGMKINIQKWLQKNVAYVPYVLAHNPLHSLDTQRYYDVMELNNKFEKIHEMQRTIDNLRNFGTENTKSIAKIKAEREKQALKTEKIAEKAKQLKIKENVVLLKNKLKNGEKFIAVVRVFSNKGRRFHGESLEFRNEKPKTNTYFEITKENLKVVAEKILQY